MTIQFRNLDLVRATIQGTPKVLTRATRSAIDRTLTQSRKRFAEIVKNDLGIKAKSVRGRTRLIRTRADQLEGRMWAFDAPIPLRDFAFRVARRSATRGAVIVRDEVGGTPRQSSTAFVNPKAGGRFAGTPYRRVRRGKKRVGRNPIRLAMGPSMAFQLDRVIAEPRFRFNAFVDTTYKRLFQQSLHKQLRKLKR